MKKIVLLLALPLLHLTHVAAQSLEEKEMRADQEKRLAEELVFPNQKCGTKITATIDWQGIDAQNGPGTYSFCGEALSALASVCDGSPMAQAEVQRKIQTFTCHRGDARALSLKDGNFDYTFHVDTPNNTDAARDFLKKNL